MVTNLVLLLICFSVLLVYLLFFCLQSYKISERNKKKNSKMDKKRIEDGGIREKSTIFVKNTAHNERRLLNYAYLCINKK
jgi:hypothetical protein